MSAYAEWLGRIFWMSFPLTSTIVKIVPAQRDFFDYLVGGFQALAAFAAVGAAWTALRQSKQANITSQRALEALGRAIRPEKLSIVIWPTKQLPDGTDPILRPEVEWPNSITVRVWNRGPFTAENVTLKITNQDGKSWTSEPATASVPGDSSYIHFVITGYEPHVSAETLRTREDDQSVKPAPMHVVTLEFSDTRELVRWRQLFQVDEVAHLQTWEPTHPRWVFLPRERVENPIRI